MVQRVIVRTGARLHFGPLSYLPERGRHFGGIGMMVDEPGFEVEASLNLRGLVTDTGGPLEMAILQRWRERSRFGGIPPVRIQTNREIPLHLGLGSGTQRALAVGEALSRLAGETTLDLPQLGLQIGRGERSAVGIYGYRDGGFLVDAGHRPEGGDIGALALRVDVPTQWRIVLITPRAPGEAVSGLTESRKFEQLSPMPERTTGNLCRIALTEILPALNSADYDGFRAGLAEYGRLVGEFFAPVQGGGSFRSPLISLANRQLGSCSGHVLAQSSWGPTAAAICENEQSAEDLHQRLQTMSVFPNLQIHHTSPRNRGRDWQTDA